MQFAMTEEQHSIRESVDRVCAEFDDDYCGGSSYDD